MVDGVSVERINELLAYDPDTGSLTWRVRPSRATPAGSKAGSIASNGRRYIGIDGFRVLAHRAAWALHHGEWPAGNIAPVNGDYLDFKLDNLKPETAAETARKGGLRKTNTTGHKGVSWDASRSQWLVHITRDYKQKYLGRFDSLDEAIAVYGQAAAESGLNDDRDAEAKDAKLKAESRDRALARARWLRLRRSHLTTGWESLAQFMADVGEQPTSDHKLVPADPTVMIGPGNFEWRIPERPEFDGQTKEGRAAYNRFYRDNNIMALRERDLMKTFGVTLADYQKMFVEQEGACAICKNPEVSERNGKAKWMAVDHDHALGDGRHSVRGLLCSACNQAIGHMKDDPARLRAAADYIERHARSDKGEAE